MLGKLSKDITAEDARIAFVMMDDDSSGSLEFT